METTARVKAVISAAMQYRINPSDANLMLLKRQMDVLLSISGKTSFAKSFKPKDVTTKECLSCLVGIINESNTKPTLAQNTMSLLNSLANIPGIKEALTNQFSLISTLGMYLATHTTGTAADPSAVLCVKLLQKLTYGCKVSMQDVYIDHLITFSISQLEGKETELTLPCLALLANLCHHNYTVQMHIKSMETKGSTLLKVLSGFLSHSNANMVTFTLAIYASIWLNDPGIKVFETANINQIFQFLFNAILMNKGSIRRYAVDLFVDLLKSSKVYSALIIYPHIKKLISNVLVKLSKTEASEAAKIFELLLSFCSVNGLRCVVCRTLLDSPGLQEPTRYKELLSRPDEISEPFFAVIHWASQTVETHDSAPLLALSFLREMYEEFLDVGVSDQTAPRTDLVLPMLSEVLNAPLVSNNSSAVSAELTPPADTIKRCEKLVKAVQLLLTMCCDDALKQNIEQTITADMCGDVVEYQLANTSLSTEHPLSTSSADSKDDFGEHGMDAVLYTLDLMLLLRLRVNGMENKLCEVLQDVRIVPYLALGLTSHCRDRVQIALRMVSRGASLQEFPNAVLGDSIAARNCVRPVAPNTSQLVDKDSTLVPNQPPPLTSSAYLSSKENIPPTSSMSKGSSVKKPSDCDIEESVQSIIEKMQNGMELHDMKQSDLISVYEHKIFSQQTNLSQLQDLLDAKTLSLQQADRLVTHYRCQLAQADVESQKLRGVLRECKREGTHYQQRLNDMTIEKESLQNDLEQMAQDVARLDEIADDYKDLQQKFKLQSQRLETAQRTIASLKQEHSTLSEIHETLRRHNETLKQQHDVASQQLSSLQEERTSLNDMLAEKEAKEKEMSKSFNRVQERLKKTEQEHEEMELAIDQLRSDLSKAEQSKKKLQDQVTSLDMLCKQHENTNKEKDGQIKTLKTEVDKHRQIATLIHSLSSGKDAAASLNI